MENYQRINADESSNLRSVNSSAVKKKSVPPYLIGIKTISRLQWDFLVTIFALFNCFLVVFYLSFECQSMMDPVLKTLGLFTDITFCLDTYYNLMTTIIDKQTGDEIINLRKIFKQYLYSNLWFDLISSIPIFFISIPCTPWVIIVTLIRLVKLKRIIVVEQRLMFFRLKKPIRVVIKFFVILLWLMIYIHLLSCLWFFIVSLDNEWEPFAVIVAGKNFYELDLSEKYSFCVYTMVASITRIEMLPATTLEYAFLGFAIILGMLIVGVLFGGIVVLLQEIGKESLKFATEKEKINTTIKNLNLPKKLQADIINFFTSSFMILDQEISYQKLVSFLPPSIKKKLNSCLFQQVFKNSKMFLREKKLVAYLIQQLDNKFCQPEEEIIKQFENGDTIYFVSDGKCKVEVLNEIKEKHNVKTLEEGAYFGEIAVLFKTSRTATVKSVEYTTLAVLSENKLNTLFMKFPNVKKSLLAGIIKYKDPYKLFIERILNKLIYLQELDEKTLNKLAYSLPIFSCPVKSDLFNAGDICNSCFMILDGQVEIMFELNGQSIITKVQRNSMVMSQNKKKVKSFQLITEILGKGSVICPNLLVLQQKLIVTCRCIQQARIMVFTRDHLDEIINKFPQVKSVVENTISKFTVWDSLTEQSNQVIIPLDYYKCQKYEETHKNKNIKLKIKFKNAVINKILKIRQSKINKLPKITSLVTRIQSIHNAEQIGRHDIASKIISGEIQPEAVNVEDMLKKKYNCSPLVTQFALKSKEVYVLSEVFKGHLDVLQSNLNEVREASEKLVNGSDILIKKYSEVKKIISKSK